MPGILDQIFGAPGSDQSQAMGLLAAGLVKGDFGGGLLAANNVFSPEAKMKRDYMQAQMQNLQSEVETRKAALARQTEGADFFRKLLAGNAQPQQPVNMGLGMPADGSTMRPQPAAGPTGLAGASPEMIAAAKALYGYDLNDQWKSAKEGFKIDPNSYRMDATSGKLRYYGDPTKGISFNPETGETGLNPGFATTQAKLAFASKAPETLLGAAAKVNLRKNPDGTETPVSELQENPTLQNILGNVFGNGGPSVGYGAPQARTAPQAAPSAAPQAPPRSAAQQPVAADTNAIYQAEWKASNDRLASLPANAPPEIRQRAQADVDGLRKEMARYGVQVPGVGYGKTTAQEIAEAAAKEKAVKTADADVTRDTSNKADSKRYGQMNSSIDRAIELLQAGPTGSGFGRAMDSTAGFFGQATQGAVIASQLKTLGGWLTANVPRMEGPQSDRDVINYGVMAGAVGDDSLPVPQRLAAASEVKRLQQKYAQLNGYGNNSPEAAAPSQNRRLDTLPATAPKGTRVRDTQTGEIKMFNGLAWVSEK